MKWYNYVFGGSKSFQTFVAMVLGFWAYMTLEITQRAVHFWELCLFLCACAGVYGFFRIREHSNGGHNDKKQ